MAPSVQIFSPMDSDILPSVRLRNRNRRPNHLSLSSPAMHDLKRLLVRPGHRFHWDKIDPDEKGHFDNKEEAVGETEALARELDVLQERLYAEHQRSLLIVLQGMDTSGKDGTVRHVMRGVNPQGCIVSSFKQPTPEELAHDFLWRVHADTPAKGFIGIFNRSHYEDVLVTRVHGLIDDRAAKDRFREINDFERLLSNNGTMILKFYLSISRDEQRRRLQSRLDVPDKHWKFNPNDLVERKRWDKYQTVYAAAIAATSCPEAPWYVIPANHKWYRNYLVAKIIARTLKKMNPQYPETDEASFRKIKIPR